MTNSRSQVSFGIAAVLLTVVIGCAPQVTLTPLGTERTYPPTPDSVAIPLYATTKPECPYDELAAITAEGRVYKSEEAEVLSALRAKARAIGAHAIIGYAQSNRATGTASGESADIHVRSGTAVRFRSPDCMK